MIRKKRKQHLIFIAGFLVLTCGVVRPVWAETDGAVFGIYDNAGLLTEEENSDLAGKMEALADKRRLGGVYADDGRRRRL